MKRFRIILFLSVLVIISFICCYNIIKNLDGGNSSNLTTQSLNDVVFEDSLKENINENWIAYTAKKKKESSIELDDINTLSNEKNWSWEEGKGLLIYKKINSTGELMPCFLELKKEKYAKLNNFTLEADVMFEDREGTRTFFGFYIGDPSKSSDLTLLGIDYISHGSNAPVLPDKMYNFKVHVNIMRNSYEMLLDDKIFERGKRKLTTSTDQIGIYSLNGYNFFSNFRITENR